MPEKYDKPKSLCYCGHTGDGPGSDHMGLNGHGRCVAAASDSYGNPCRCNQFTWKEWLPEFVEYLKPAQVTIPL